MITRRKFMAACGAASTLAAAPAIVRGRNLNSRLQLAAIGCEGKGWSDVRETANHEKAVYVGFCDVDLARTAKVRKLAPDAPVLQDYRDLLDKLADQVDAVTVSTPDHMHAFISLDAMRRGKHVFCQKPLTHNVWEARQMRLQAARSEVITRMGNQIHSHAFYRTALAAVQEGVIGKVKRVESWCAATGHGKSFHISRPKHPPSAPKTVDWNLWIGVAPMRPYGGDRVYHPWGWRDWQDFGNGALGDFGCHILDPVFTALKISRGPLDMHADHTGLNDEVWPAQNTVKYTFPGTSLTAAKTLPLTWYDGGRLPSVRGSAVPPTTALPRSGSLLIGEKGSLVLPHVGAPRLYPQEKLGPLREAADRNHYHGWIDGCLAGEQPSDGFDYAGLLTESVLLGNIAVRYRGETLRWSEDDMQFTSHPDAQRWLTRAYRPGWEIQPVV